MNTATASLDADPAALPDDAAFVAALESAAGPHLALALRMLGREEEAREVVQDAWLRAWRHRGAVREAAALHGWLRQIVARECLRSLRRRALTRWLSWGAELPEAPSPAPGPEHAVADAQALARVRRAVERLPPKQRLAWGLRFDEGWSVPEIAAAMGTSAETTKTHLGRALERVVTETELHRAP